MSTTCRGIRIGVVLLLIFGAGPLLAQGRPSLAGQWMLNRELSQFPHDIGFGADMAPADQRGGEGAAGGRGGGRRGTAGGDAGAWMTRRESPDDARRLQLLTDEVRNPPALLTVAQTPAAVTFTPDGAPSRSIRSDGRETVLQVADVPVSVTAKWDANRLVVVYRVEEGRELHYTYSTSANPDRLVVEVKFVERNGRDVVRRVYEPATDADVERIRREPPPPPVGRPEPSLPAAARRTEPAAPPQAPPTSAPPTPRDEPQTPVGARVPDGELKGITAIGLVVEDLSSQATACGLVQSTLEAAAAKSLASAGLRVMRNSDEDTYVYVNVITNTLPGGLCVSRYDVFVYTNTLAKLSYQDKPALVQVSLLHKGGMAGGGSAAHAAAVLQGVTEHVGAFAARIRDANK